MGLICGAVRVTQDSTKGDSLMFKNVPVRVFVKLVVASIRDE